MLGERIERDVVSYVAAVQACHATLQWATATRLFVDTRRTFLVEEAAAVATLSAQLCITDAVVARALAAQSADALRASACGPRDLPALAWSLAMHNVDCQGLLRSLAAVAMSDACRLGLQDTSTILWAFATLAAEERRLFEVLANETARKLTSFGPCDLPDDLWPRLASDAISIIWSFSYVGLLEAHLVESVRTFVAWVARGLDAAPKLRKLSGFAVRHAERDTLDEPQVMQDLCDRLVVMKPPDWQVGASALGAREPCVAHQLAIGCKAWCVGEGASSHLTSRRISASCIASTCLAPAFCSCL